MARAFICDKELAALLCVSTSTITRAARGKNKHRNALDDVKPVYVGGARRWNVDLVARALGMTGEELERKL